MTLTEAVETIKRNCSERQVCYGCPLMRWIDYGIDGELQYCNILNAISEHKWKLEAIIARFSPFNRNIVEDEE